MHCTTIGSASVPLVVDLHLLLLHLSPTVCSKELSLVRWTLSGKHRIRSLVRRIPLRKHQIGSVLISPRLLQRALPPFGSTRHQIWPNSVCLSGANQIASVLMLDWSTHLLKKALLQFRDQMCFSFDTSKFWLRASIVFLEFDTGLRALPTCAKTVYEWPALSYKTHQQSITMCLCNTCFYLSVFKN